MHLLNLFFLCFRLRCFSDLILNFLIYFQFLLKKWDIQLQNRSKEEKISTKGKLALATYKQTQEYLKPLLRKLKTHTLPEDISDSLTEIVEHLLNRNYLKVCLKYYFEKFGE